MPRIQGYEEHIGAQGGLNVQASPNDFGAQVGAAAQNLGGAIETAAHEVQQYNATQDVTNVHVNMAKARAEWTQTLKDRANSAQPGDDTFAPTMMQDMDAYFAKGAASASTPQGKAAWAREAASMSSEFGIRAIGIQSELAAKDAQLKYTTLATSLGQTVHTDPTQFDITVAQANRAIDDPNGMFAKVPQTTRDEFKDQMKRDLSMSVLTGMVRREGGPEAIMGSISPDVLKTFDLPQKLVNTATVPGAVAKISKGAMQWAPDVQAAGAAKGVNSNILLAQLDAESGGNPKAVSPVGAAGVSQFMPATAAQYGVDVRNPKSSINGQAAFMGDLLKKYGGDYSKALAAYNWGPGNLDKALSTYGNTWRSHLPSETSNYITKVMTNAGAVAPTGDTSMSAAALAPTPVGADAAAPTTPGEAAAPVDNSQRAPVASTLAPMANLNWQQQDQILGQAIHFKHMAITNENHAREMADLQLKKQRETADANYINRIIDPDNYGGYPSNSEIANDQILTGQQKQSLADYALRRQIEQRTGIENKPNPAEVRRLMLQIHAADDDPTKTYSFDPVMASYKNGDINTNEMKFLRTEVEQMKDGNGNNFAKQANQAREVVYQSFTRSIIGQTDPARAAGAAYAFGADMQDKILQYRKAGKDPSVLLDPSSREYLLKPERINAFLPGVTFDAGTAANASASSTLAAQAAKMAAGTVKDGYRFKGGDPRDKANWEKL